MTLIDANVLIDVFTDDPAWAEWSHDALVNVATAGEIGINPIIYAEVSIAFEKPEGLEAALAPLELIRWELPYTAAFRAGKAFLEYRRSEGTRRSPLPDFYIGAHAECAKLSLLTRDAQRYRTYFPTVNVIAP